MLDQLTNASTLSLLGLVLLLAVSLYLSVRMRRIEGIIKARSPLVDSMANRPDKPAEPSPPMHDIPAHVSSEQASRPEKHATAEQAEAITQQLDAMHATLTVIAAGERPLMETKLLAWSFEEATALIRRDDRDPPSDLGSVVCRFLR